MHLHEHVRAELVEAVAPLGPERDRLSRREEVRDVRRLPPEQEERTGEAEDRHRKLDAGHPATRAALELSDSLVAGFLGRERIAFRHGSPERLGDAEDLPEVGLDLVLGALLGEAELLDQQRPGGVEHLPLAER